jgi:hypothetical protein
MIENPPDHDKTILTLDVNNANTGRSIAAFPVNVSQFKQPSQFQDFDVPFTAPPYTRLEFRTYYYGGCTMTQQSVTVRPGTTGGSARPAAMIFDAAEGPHHGIGHAEGSAWCVNAGDGANFLRFGPYTPAAQPGANIATFRLMIDNTTADDNKVLNLDINDADTNQVIAQMPITRGQFHQPSVYQDFKLPFDTQPVHRLEFRVFFCGGAGVKLQNVTVTPGVTAPAGDADHSKNQ